MIDLLKLVKDAQAGDRSAFRRLVEETRADLFHLILGILRNHGDAEDVLMKVGRKHPDGDVRNEALDLVREWVFDQ